MKKLILLCASVLFSTSGTSHALEFEKQQVADGLATIVASSEPCGYALNEEALEAYYVKVGLATPEGLAFVSNMISLKSFGDKPNKTECTLARTTARSSGVLQ